VGVSFISSSEDAKGKKVIIKEVCEAAEGISKQMGYLERKALGRLSRADQTG